MPNSRSPGVSIIHPFSDKLYLLEKLVVCVPFCVRSLISLTFCASYPRILFRKVDLPAPDGPLITDFRFSIVFFNVAMPILCNALI